MLYFESFADSSTFSLDQLSGVAIDVPILYPINLLKLFLIWRNAGRTHGRQAHTTLRDNSLLAQMFEGTYSPMAG